MSKEEIKQLEQMIEIIARSIPKEQAAAKLYADTASKASNEMARMLFARLHSESEQHVTKLAATLDILRKDLLRARNPESDPSQGTACMPAHEFNVNIRRTLRVSKELQDLAQDGLTEANDPSCRKMYEAMQDFAAQLRAMAQEEIEKHINAEKWD